jgi:dCMP deaminase
MIPVYDGYVVIGTKPYCHRRASGISDSQKDRACVSSHAEANAIAQAARLGIATEGAVLYCTTRPCAPCAKLLIQAGIVDVFYELDYDEAIQNDFITIILNCKQLSVRPEIIKLAQAMLEPDTSRRKLARTK